MAVVFTDEAMARIDQLQHERVARMARKAEHFEISPDPVKDGAWIVRNPRVPHRIELVDQNGRCSCHQFRVWGRCKHAALVATRKGDGR